MPKVMLADLTEGMIVNTLACVIQKRLLPFRNKSGSFLLLTLGDRSGSLDAKVFNHGEEIAGRVGEGGIVNISDGLPKGETMPLRPETLKRMQGLQATDDPQTNCLPLLPAGQSRPGHCRRAAA